MGAEFEAQAYIPGSFDMTDSSVNSNGNMSPFYEEKKAKLHESHKFTILSENGSVHYDKEMIKRTMLVHDATFRKQVYELHHLYKIQKELMAQLEGEEFDVYPRYADTLKSQAHSPGDVKAEWQDGTPISGHDLKQSSIDFINETSSQYSVNGASRRYSNNSSAKKMLDLELPADVCANDKDVKIMDDNPLKCLSWPDGSVRDVRDRIKLGNSESKHVKSWTTGTQPRHNSAVHIFNKPVEGPSNMKITDSISVGASTQKQPYLLWNLKNLALQGNWREKPAGEAYGSCFFGANEEIRHTNSSRQRTDDPNTSRAWLQHNQNNRNSSFGQYLSSNGAFNHFIPAPPLFSDAPNSPWQSSNMSHYGFSMDSTNTPCRRQLKMHGKPQYQKPPTHKNIVKDLDLNDVPADTSATWQEGRETSTVGTPTFSEKAIGLMKSQVPPSCANDLPQTCVSSMSYSDNGIATRIPSIPIGTPAERDSQFSPSPERDINIAAPIKSEADKEMHPQSKSADSSIRNLFDLNETLPISDDDLEVDPCEPEGGIAPHEPNNDPSRDTLAVTAAENLVAMGNDSTHPGSPKLDTLHWFADLATFKENDDSGDDFEALTLKLEETKSHELVVLPAPTTLEDDSNNDGRCSPASYVAARPRRGKARGRPAKKRDFQRDVLPSLPSLPEQQVSEDLCLLGRAKLATPSKRGGRNGQQQQQPRGRRRTRSVAAVVVEEEAEVSPQSAPPPLPPAPADSGADAPLMTRWGRTTRRCRRPRCPPVNNASLHVA